MKGRVDTAAFSAALVDWYQDAHRDLPWRRTRDPYRIWLSEVMLQQTQVETVLPYYERFLARWPTVAALAAAPVSDVMKAWEGLGYYARCRNLHRAAQQMMAEHGGTLPDTFEAVHALPGVGRSTAGAILTFARGQRWPLLDGNVRRVLCRLGDLNDDPRRAEAERTLWGWSQELLDGAADAWSHNQAMMELGARVCTPTSPACPTCPVGAWCAARAAGTQLERPVRTPRRPLPHHEIGVGVIERDGRVLIQLRPPEGLLGGLWEFPGGKRQEGETLEDTVRREVAEELGLEVAVGARIARVPHTYSHFRITLFAFRCTWVAGQEVPTAATEVRWVRPDELRRFAFPRANRRVLDAMLGPEPPA